MTRRSGPLGASAVRYLGLSETTPVTRRMAVGRGIRAALVTFTGFALGLWVFHNIEVAVFSAFAGIAITGIADFRGRRGFRVAAVSASALLGAGLVALGSAMAARPVWAQMIVIFCVVATVAFGRIMGGYALAGADAVTLFYLVASGSSAPISALPSRLAGVALGGALAVVVAWTQRDRATTPQLGRVLGQVISEAADRLRRLSQADRRPRPLADDRVPALTVRQLVDQRPDRPNGPIPSQRAALYLVNDLERLDGLLTRLEGADGPPTPAQMSTLGGLSTQLADASSLLQRPGPPGPLGALPIEEGFGLLARLSLVSRSITVHADSFGAAQGARRGRMGTRGVGEFLVHSGRRFRANLNFHSVRLQDSVRLGLGLMVGVLAIHLLDLQHGFWVALATLSVVKSDARRTGRSLGEAVVGTAIGFGIAAGVIAAIGSRPGWLAAALPLTLFAAFYAKGALSFLVGQAAFTMAVLVMFNLLAPFGWSLGVVRLEDVAAGALIGLAVGVLAWPRGAEASIGWTTSRLVEASSRYLVESVDPLGAGGRGAGPTLSEASGAPPRGHAQSALDAALLADDVFAEFLDEHPGGTGARRWAEVISFGNRMRYAGDVISTQRERTECRRDAPEPACSAVDLLEETCRRLAERLRGSEGGPGAARVVEPFDPEQVDDLTLWIQDLTESAHALLAAETTERRNS